MTPPRSAAGASPHAESKDTNSGALPSLPALEDKWRDAGFRDIRSAEVAVDLTYANFDDLWQPYQAGSTPSTARFVRLDAAIKAQIENRVRAAVLPDGGRDDGPITMTAHAWCVAGRVV